MCSKTYALIYTPRLKSSGLHKMALGYMRRVTLGAYMWRNGLKWVKQGAKWGLLSRLRTPNGPKFFLKKHFYDPICNAFVVTKWAIFKAFGTLDGPKKNLKSGSSWAYFTCLCTPCGPQSLLGKHIFDPFFNHFWSQNTPFSRHFGIFHGPKRVTRGSK